MNRHTNSRKLNEHPGSNGRPNGHDPAYAERGGVPALRDQAASDDASGDPVAHAATFPAAANLHAQASTDREACAEVAPPPPNETQMLPQTNASADMSHKEKEIPRGRRPLPDNPAEFVEEIHRKIDLIEVWHRQLRSKDEKIQQRAIEKLTAMLYEDGAISSEDSEQIIFDLPRPKRD